MAQDKNGFEGLQESSHSASGYKRVRCYADRGEGQMGRCALSQYVAPESRNRRKIRLTELACPMALDALCSDLQVSRAHGYRSSV